MKSTREYNTQVILKQNLLAEGQSRSDVAAIV
jgi:hypothetical protein